MAILSKRKIPGIRVSEKENSEKDYFEREIPEKENSEQENFEKKIPKKDNFEKENSRERNSEKDYFEKKNSKRKIQEGKLLKRNYWNKIILRKKDPERQFSVK